MIKPEILEMVEECCRTYCYGCKNKKLCVEFITHFTLVPEHYNGTQLGDVLSFLTSQEVCECGTHFEKDMIATEYKCKSCGKIIKEVISEKDLLKPFSEFEKENNIKGIRNDMDKKGE